MTHDNNNDGVPTQTTQTTTLSATRETTGAYVARNDRGGELRIGKAGVEGCFSPGELLQIAAAACVALAADFTLARRLGDDFEAAVFVSAALNESERRYTDMSVRLAADMSAVEESRRDALRERAGKAVDRLCTVGHTLRSSACVQVDLE
ncbi:OsmC family protein [Rhodococcus erythropolis]|uniref:OsmC family protein n=1 Tax=Rhodococcus erythropolis TaxID=1833 RepID=UPI0008D409F1|nr:OsmC family protein [Rhodococcus erythropolis]OFV79054.1 OsmC-like protein [Rhodococcus erythropolis]